MPFIQNLLQYSSVSIVGLEKNTGKTECLNYVLGKLKNHEKRIAVTSIGVDGEDHDRWYQNAKPEITLYENMILITSEKHYREKQLIAEILAIGTRHTALGRMITAHVKNEGKIILSGPSDTVWLQQLLQTMKERNVDLTLVDGALSRLSLASPTVTDAMILTTGAALSENIPQLVKKTHFAYQLICLEEVDGELKEKLKLIHRGIWGIDETQEIHNLHIPSLFGIGERIGELFSHGSTIFISGAISDQILNALRLQKKIENTTLIIRDFTKAFFSENAYNEFIKRGGKIKVLDKSKLIAVCVNPVSPGGFRLNSMELQKKLEETLNIPVYDVRYLS